MPDIGERRLATIRRVSKIEPIEGADRIVKATIDGWELVTQKTNYKVGDLCVYFEIDSFLPVRPEFEFLRSSCFKSTVNLGDGFRIKTIKLKGQVSQGLSLPMKDFFIHRKDAYGNDDWYYEEKTEDGREVTVHLSEGADVTEYFGVQKYEKPLHAPGSRLGPMNAKGRMPFDIPKTDQERIQNHYQHVMNWMFYAQPEVYEVTDERMLALLEQFPPVVQNTIDTQYFKTDKWYKRFRLRNSEEVVKERIRFEATLKLDGSSMTVYHKDGEVGVCSRNWELKEEEGSVFWETARKIKILEVLEKYGHNVAVQGELMGPGVQGNREELKNHKFFIFDVYGIDDKRYLDPNERHYFMMMLQDGGIDVQYCDHVPYVMGKPGGVVEFHDGMDVKDFLAMAEIPSIKHPIAEGVVFKSMVPGGPTFKAISNRYLLKEKD